MFRHHLNKKRNLTDNLVVAASVSLCTKNNVFVKTFKVNIIFS